MVIFPDENSAVSRLAEQYGTEARAYQRLWAPVIHPAACRLLDWIPERPVVRALDLGAGVGMLIPEIRNRHPRAVVVGADRSEGMLCCAPTDALLAVTDASRLGIESNSLDLVVMAFVLFHLPQPARGLSEARRALRSGGLLGLTTWADDLDSPAVEVWNEELEAHGAVDGDSLGRIANHDLMDSPAKVVKLLESSGFSSARAEIQQFVHPIDLDSFIEMRSGVGGNRQRLESLDDESRGRCIAQARRRLSLLSADDLTLRFRVVLSCAESP